MSATNSKTHPLQWIFFAIIVLLLLRVNLQSKRAYQASQDALDVAERARVQADEAHSTAEYANSVAEDAAFRVDEACSILRNSC